MDAFIKIPRPDASEDNLGLKFLDEPSSNQSNPTVLELQLRAQSKKMQYGDVAVRSIENAAKHAIVSVRNIAITERKNLSSSLYKYLRNFLSYKAA